MVAFGKGLKVRQSGGRPLLGQDRAEDGSRIEAGEAAEVEGGLGLPGSREDSPFLDPKRKDVARPTQVLGACLGIDERLNRDGPIKCRDAGRRSRFRIHRYAIGNVTRGRLIGDHDGDPKCLEALPGQGHTDNPPGFSGHKVHGLRGHPLRRQGQHAFTLSGLIIGQDHHPPLPDGPDRLLHRMAGHFHSSTVVRMALRWVSGTSRGTTQPGAKICPRPPVCPRASFT